MRDGKLLQRGAMGVLAVGVAVIAAVASYSHIYDLGRLHGGSGSCCRSPSTRSSSSAS
jgi:hypothetical protein